MICRKNPDANFKWLPINIVSDPYESMLSRKNQHQAVAVVAQACSSAAVHARRVRAVISSMAHTSLIADIARKLKCVDTQVNMGTGLDQLLDEQCNALLATFPTSHGLTMDQVFAVSEHLSGCGSFTPKQLASFKACLRLASSKNTKEKKGKPDACKLVRSLESTWCNLVGTR